MKHLLSKASLAMALACTAPIVLAQTPSQTPSVDYGRTTVQLNSGFVGSLQSLGAVVTDLQGNALQNNSVTVLATGGAVDLTTSAGDIEHTGGLRINVAGAVIRIQNFIIDTSNPTAPVITADFVANDHFTARIPLFNFQPPAGFSLPLHLTAGVLQENGLILTLAPATAATLNALFGAQVIPAGITIGTANVYVVFAAQN